MADHSHLVTSCRAAELQSSSLPLCPSSLPWICFQPSSTDAKDLDDRVIKDNLRKILKRLGKLKCSKEVTRLLVVGPQNKLLSPLESRQGCGAAFSSVMGYVYHMRKCGKQESELEKLLLNCSHCGKAYRSKAGLEYHLRSEHAPVSRSARWDQPAKIHRLITHTAERPAHTHHISISTSGQQHSFYLWAAGSRFRFLLIIKTKYKFLVTL